MPWSIVRLARAEQMINDPEITQEEVDDMVKELQVSVDELVEVNDSTNAEDPTNTSAVNTTNAVFALMIAAGAASIAAYRRKRSWAENKQRWGENLVSVYLYGDGKCEMTRLYDILQDIESVATYNKTWTG